MFLNMFVLACVQIAAAQRTGRGAPRFVVRSFPVFVYDAGKVGQTMLASVAAKDKEKGGGDKGDDATPTPTPTGAADDGTDKPPRPPSPPIEYDNLPPPPSLPTNDVTLEQAAASERQDRVSSEKSSVDVAAGVAVTDSGDDAGAVKTPPSSAVTPLPSASSTGLTDSTVSPSPPASPTKTGHHQLLQKVPSAEAEAECSICLMSFQVCTARQCAVVLK
jgi:hypothetical protein